jgi:selenocysteine-specific elongation factor
MRVIGTAGHVDHGKSTLIEALTGTHPDRLKEEQDRQMTIDLGFGWLRLPNGEEIGIVDVPGHRDFVDNMLAGITGIDAALLVVAADEGIMPQTREHLAILDLLRIPAGVIALTKTDLIADEEWFQAVEADIRKATIGTALERAPLVRVSARTRTGLDELLDSLAEVLRNQPDRTDLGRPRLPIDRVFTMSGFGTVVTGTLSDGPLEVGEEVEILPSGLRGRVRGLQNHRRKVDRALPGSRTAANISGVSAGQLRRGEVLTRPGQHQITRRLDARFRALPDLSVSVVHNSQVKVFSGTSETMATLRLLDSDELTPGQEGWIQMELGRPLVCVRGDAFIVRRPSPAETLGGGMVMDAHPAARHKRFDADVLASLGSLATGDPAGILLQTASALGAASLRDIVMHSHLGRDAAVSALQQLVTEDRLILLESGPIGIDSDVFTTTAAAWGDVRQKIETTLAAYHRRFRLRHGIPREELKSQLDLAPRLFNAAIERLARAGVLAEAGNLVALADHEIRFDPREQAAADDLMQRFGQDPFSPPGIKECQATAGPEIVSALITLGELIPVSADVIFRKRDYDSMVAGIRDRIKSQGQITLAEVRDQFGTSRRYAQALLEHLDALGVTRRSGDARVFAT